MLTQKNMAVGKGPFNTKFLGLLGIFKNQLQTRD